MESKAEARREVPKDRGVQEEGATKPDIQQSSQGMLHVAVPKPQFKEDSCNNDVGTDGGDEIMEEAKRFNS